jgi:hypothetical protein
VKSLLNPAAPVAKQTQPLMALMLQTAAAAAAVLLPL